MTSHSVVIAAPVRAAPVRPVTTIYDNARAAPAFEGAAAHGYLKPVPLALSAGRGDPLAGQPG
jgi:hypothetical protein